MTYKVIQWATGTVARDAIKGIVGHRDLELVGTWVHSADKDGRDVGELCGIAPLGVVATRDQEALLAMKADCVCFMPGRSWVANPMETFAELLRILRSGKNVVNLWWPSMVYPKAMDGDVFRQLEDACLEGGSSIVSVGMDPGFGTAGLALSALTLSRQVDSIRMIQVMNNAYWEGPGITLFFGFGQPDTSQSPMLHPGNTTSYHATTLHMLADALGVSIDEIVEEHSVIYADEAFDIASGHIPAGTVSGIWYKVKGMVDGTPMVTVEHVERLREQDFPELAFAGDGYRVEITGEPCSRLDMTVSKLPTFAGDPIAVACAMSVVNAIPQVCAAPPGVLSLLDLKPIPPKHLSPSR
ncbi:MAG TPA: hypothetical protein VGM78_07160 [Ilumatobacteraceae bacterium]|jgi:4-hydroxy-tetrahydrodipicolinate reductase